MNDADVKEMLRLQRAILARVNRIWLDDRRDREELAEYRLQKSMGWPDGRLSASQQRDRLAAREQSKNQHEQTRWKTLVAPDLTRPDDRASEAASV